MAFCLTKSLSGALRLRSSEVIGAKSCSCARGLLYSTKRVKKEEIAGPPPDDEFPTSGISRPISEILKELNKKVPDSLIRARTEANGFSIKYIPWLKSSGLLRTQGLIGGKWIDAYDGKTIEEKKKAAPVKRPEVKNHHSFSHFTATHQVLANILSGGILGNPLNKHL